MDGGLNKHFGPEVIFHSPGPNVITGLLFFSVFFQVFLFLMIR
jgi:hypothetical protein